MQVQDTTMYQAAGWTSYCGFGVIARPIFRLDIKKKKMSAGQNQDFQKKTTYESDKI